MACSFNAAEQNPGSLSLLLSDSPSDSCAALNLINAAVFCDCARTKTGLMDSRLPFRSLFCFSKARWFNKPAPFDSQGLNPPGEETKTRPKKKGKKTKNPKCSRFFFFSSNPSFFFFFGLSHPAGSGQDPAWLTATSGPGATAAAARSLSLPAVPVYNLLTCEQIRPLALLPFWSWSATAPRANASFAGRSEVGGARWKKKRPRRGLDGDAIRAVMEVPLWFFFF